LRWIISHSPQSFTTTPPAASTGVNSAAKAAKALSGSSETTATELCDSRKFSILARDMPPQASAATAYHAPPGASAVNATALSAK
jgi:hypothetical protein